MPESGAQTVDISQLEDLLTGKTLDRIKVECRAIGKLVDTARDLRSADVDALVRGLRQVLVNESLTDGELRGLNMLSARADVQHINIPLLRACIEAGVPAYLHGEAGSGKTSAAHSVAKMYGLDFRSISLSPSLMDSKLLGYLDASGTYRGTGFRQVYEAGGVFLFDEIDNCNPSSLAVINNALANSSAEFADTRVDKHPNTRIVAAANTIGKGATSLYVGRAAIDAATLDRFAFIEWGIDERFERSLVLEGYKSHEEVDITLGGVPTTEDWLDEVQGYRSRLRSSGIRHIISPRASIYGRDLAAVGVGIEHLKEMLIFKGLSETDRDSISARRGW